MVHLDYRDARPIYAQITDCIREQIRTGVLRQGDRLSSVRELAGQLAINPNTIQRAYRELEAAGLIATVPGKGCYVCGSTRGRDLSGLLETFDTAADELLRGGMTVDELIVRLKERGNILA